MSQLLASTLIQQPHRFDVGKRAFFIHPLTLGKVYLLQGLHQDLGMEMDGDALPFVEALRVASTHRLECARFIAAHTLQSPDELMGLALEHRAEFFAQKLTTEERAQLLLLCLSLPTAESLMKELGIDKERERMAEALAAKGESRNTLSFGAKTVYGQLIAAAAEKFGWTLHYILWDISLSNLQLLLADASQSIYLTDEEANRAGRFSSHLINGDDPDNAHNIAQLLDLD